MVRFILISVLNDLIFRNIKNKAEVRIDIGCPQNVIATTISGVEVNTDLQLGLEIKFGGKNVPLEVVGPGQFRFNTV